MKWEKINNCEWEARGAQGNFVLTKISGNWHGQYLSRVSSKFFTLPAKQSLKELKRICEDNYYWEN